ncbi:MAG: putative porin [Mariprofundaceae bacterium]
MNKILLSTMGAIAIAFGGMAMAPSAAQAGVAVGDDGKLKIGGTVRFRTEYDKRENSAAPSQTRDRLRLRLRLNGTYQADENWSLGFRLRTQSDNRHSPHKTFGLAGSSGSTAFGLDRAYIKYKNDSGLTVWGGKNGVNFWEQTEVFWDADYQPEGVAVTYKNSGFTLNAGYFQLSEGNWQGGAGAVSDVNLFTYQGVYSTKLSGLKYTVGIGGAQATNAVLGDFVSDGAFTAGLQVKGSNWRLGGEFFQGDGNGSENTGYTIQARYKFSSIGNGLGLRLYYYDIGAHSTPLDGAVTQDNFPSGNTAPVNFTGYRVQLDYKIASNVSADLRYYYLQAKTTPAPALGASALVGDSISRAGWSRTQLNLNVKF